MNMNESRPSSNPRRTREEIEEWFVSYLSRQLELPAERIDVTIPFDDFALDSATAIMMTGDLEEWLGRRIDPTLVYDYPTITDLAEFLAHDRPSAETA